MALNRLANHVERWLTVAIELNMLERATIMLAHADVLATHIRRLNTIGERMPLFFGNLAGALLARGQRGRAVEYLIAEIGALED